MTVKKIISKFIIFMLILLTLSACETPGLVEDTNSENITDAESETIISELTDIIGDWKSELGLELTVYENGTYKLSTAYGTQTWTKSEDEKSFEFIDRSNVAHIAHAYINSFGECLEIDSWGKFYKLYSENDTSDGFVYELEQALPFIDNRTLITYKNENNKSYTSLIDTNGNILYSEADSYILDYKNLNDNIHFYTECSPSNIWCIVSNETHILLNNDGKVITTSQGGTFDKVLACGEGIALVYKNNSNINGSSHCFGVLDNKGNWKVPLTQIDQFASIKTFRYAGDGIFQSDYVGSDYKSWLYNSNTGEFLLTEINSWVCFRNGEAYYGFDNEVYKIDLDFNKSKVPGFNSAKNGRLIKHKNTANVEIFDPLTNKTIVLSKYDAKQIEVKEIRFSGNDIFLIIKGKDNNKYYTIIDENGNEYYEPKKIKSSYDSGFTFSESKLAYGTDHDYGTGIDYVTFEDINGNIIAENVKVDVSSQSMYPIFFSNNIATINDLNSNLLFVNQNGETVIKRLKNQK